MTTRLNLLSAIRETLADRSAWPDATLHTWIAAAVRDYNNFFPRRTSAAISCAAGTRLYSLAAYPGFQAVALVEYPRGETPPSYLERRPEASPNFCGQPVYDLRGSPPAALVLGETPTAGETIELHYLCDHAVPGDDAVPLTIPDRHLELLKLYVIWQAVSALEMAENLHPDQGMLLLSALRLNAANAESAYRSRLQELLAAAAPTGCAGPWRMDNRDRIY